MTLYLQDLPVGRRLSNGTHTVDAEQIKGFARQFDPQPFHLDDEAAAASFFGGLAASGWHTAAITMRLIATMRPSIAGGVIGAGAQLDWPTATRPGDVLRVECEVLEARPLRSKPDRGLVLMHIKTLNQRDEVRQDLKAKLIVFQRP
jgi:acyl dehydratase